MSTIRNCFVALLLGATYPLSANQISSVTFTDIDKGWNSPKLVKLYFHNSETQRQWAWENLSKISWAGNEKVLDFASGDGKITAHMARLVRRSSDPHGRTRSGDDRFRRQGALCDAAAPYHCKYKIRVNVFGDLLTWVEQA
jgi:hypothetical protein